MRTGFKYLSFSLDALGKEIYKLTVNRLKGHAQLYFKVISKKNKYRQFPRSNVLIGNFEQM